MTQGKMPLNILLPVTEIWELRQLRFISVKRSDHRLKGLKHCIEWYCIGSQCIVLCCVVLYCTVLYRIVLYCTVLYVDVRLTCCNQWKYDIFPFYIKKKENDIPVCEIMQWNISTPHFAICNIRSALVKIVFFLNSWIHCTCFHHLTSAA